MNETPAIDTQVISDIVLNAQQAMSDLLNPLFESNNNPDNVPPDFSSIQNNILVQFENIGMMAEMSGLNGLTAVCVQYQTQLTTLPLTNSMDALSIQSYLDICLLNILNYLQDWQSAEGVEELLNSLPDTTEQDSIRALLQHDSDSSGPALTELDDTLDAELDEVLDAELDEVLDAELDEVLDDDLETLFDNKNDDADDDLLDIDSIFAEDANSGISLDSAEGIMALFCHELDELQPQISTLSQKIINIDNNSQAAEEALSQYRAMIYRIRNSCDELALSGLVKIFDFVLVNVNLVTTLNNEARAKAQFLLADWPQVVINHLQAPADNALCLAVVDYLEDQAWPEPLNYSEIRDLIDGLTKELELTGDFEVEARKVEALAEDVKLDISEDTNQQLLDAFFAECPGYAEDLTSRIANIVNGDEIVDNTKAAQRISHSIKGSANLIGSKGIASLAHHLEDIFEYFAKLAIAPPKALAYTMTEAADTIEVMIESLQGFSAAPDDAQRILQDVLNWANRMDQGNITDDNNDISESNIVTTTIESDAILAEKKSDDISKADNDVPATETTPPVQADLIRVPRETMDQIFNLIGETSIAIAQVQEHLKRMHQRGNDMQVHEKNLQSRRFELENLVSVRSLAATQKKLSVVAGSQQFDSLEMDQYDEYYGATHSFIEAVSDSRESNLDVMSHIIDLEGLFLQQQRLNRSLENIVTTSRMVPVKTIVARLQRAVRQACRATGKQAELDIIGDQLLMDGDVLNQLADPLMHLLRNAIDHGIETSDERQDKGKPASGKITLRFFQEGNSIKVNCSDDGAGLDYETIRWIAMEKNLIDPQENIDNASLARVILNSGFSTREKATQISGRGVGMDVVYTAVLKLKGAIEITDNLPSGTVFNLRLPITLLTSHSILVQIEDNRFAIPTAMLDQILPPGTGKFQRLDGEKTFQHGKNIYPIKSLSQMLGIEESDPINNNNHSIVLLVHFNSKIIAVTVERILSNYDLVVKSMGSYIKHVSGIAGIALLGDGGVVPVLDMVELIGSQKSAKQFQRSSRHEAVQKIQLSKVLIVDDSLSVRKSLSQLVQDAGYEPLLAHDGLEALEIMKKIKPDLVLTDLEMPRMTGLELTSHIRANSGNAKLPIFMITSRTMAKHQEQAQKAGVDEYITKPFSEDELISKLGQAING